MGYTDTSTSLKDSNEKNDKSDTEVVLNSSKNCCKNCKRNKYFAVLQGLFNIALLVLIIVLFIIVSKFQVKIDESLLQTSRTKLLQTENSLRKQYSVGDNIVNDTDKKNSETTTSTSTTPETTVKLKSKPFLTSLQVLDTEVHPNLVRIWLICKQTNINNADKIIFSNSVTGIF